MMKKTSNQTKLKKGTMTYGYDGYNQALVFERINALRSSEGGDTKPMVLIVKYERNSNTDREEVL